MGGPVHELVVCMGSACFAHGNNENVREIQELIQTRGLAHRVRLSGSLCQNRCKQGPNLLIDEVCHGQVHGADLPGLLEEGLGERP